MPREPHAKVNLTLRIPEHLRARIEAAAQAAETSSNIEIGRRLEQSFQNESPFGRPETYRLMLSVANRLQNIEQRLERPWFAQLGDVNDEATFAFQEELARFQYDLAPRTVEESASAIEENERDIDIERARVRGRR